MCIGSSCRFMSAQENEIIKLNTKILERIGVSVIKYKEYNLRTMNEQKLLNKNP